MNEAQKKFIKPFEVTVTDIGIRGDGIAHGKSKRYFIPYSAPGDRLSISGERSGKGDQRAKINKIISQSETRTNPTCPHFGTCGGWALQHLVSKEPEVLPFFQ